MMIKAGFFGFGLIGGSLAKHIRRVYPDAKIYAYDIDEEGLQLALKDSTLDAICHSPSDLKFAECNYLFLCTPVSIAKDFLPYIKSYIQPDCILTDVGSVKNIIHSEIKKAGLSEYFIGAHPMAGSEKSGYMHATDTLFENVYYFITPESTTSQEKLTRYTDFISSLGILPLVLDYETHDFVTAGVSHIPHIVASALVHLVSENDTKERYMKKVAAGGFKDITRIASSSPIMWQNICLANKDAIVTLLDNFMAILTSIRKDIVSENADQLMDYFSQARSYRDNLNDARTSVIQNIFAIQCDLSDRVGEISSITSVLAKNSINLKNLEILHNREGLEGVLQLEFYDEASRQTARRVLEEASITVFIP